MALEQFPVREGQRRVRGRLDPDDVRVGGGAGLVVLDVLDAEAREHPEELARAEVRAVCDRDARAGAREREQHVRDGAHARRVEERIAALELAQRVLRGDAGRVVVAGVVELARLARLVVGPDGRAVDRLGHAATSSTRRSTSCSVLK